MDVHKALIMNVVNMFTMVEVPFFQRSYVWKEDLWERFQSDMEYVTATKKSHFFGSIILKEGKKPEPGDRFAERWTVVDGQQRLTTFLIFLKVLCLKKHDLTTFDSHFRIAGKTLALRHGRNDIDAFEKIMDRKRAETIDNPAPGSRILEAFNYFVEHMDENKLDYIIITSNVQFVCIELGADEEEQQIFDSINSLGVSLTTSELLKNYFFSRETIHEYQEKWVDVFEKDDETKAYWDTEIETGRVKRALIDIFFDSFFQIFIQDRSYNISNEDKLTYARVDRLAQSYQHFISNYCGGNKAVVLDKMKEYALCFMQNFQPGVCDSNIPGSFGIERLNVVIFGLKNTTLIPYVLYVAKNADGEEERNRMYGILESYIMRRMIVHASTKNYNNLFTSLILNAVLDANSLVSRLETSPDATTFVPTDEDLQKGFANSKLVNLQARGIIYLIESKIRPANSATILHGFNHYSLEHLLPKKWRNNWAPCATEDLARQRDSRLLTLGNLAIIPQSLNASIRDGDWLTKKAGKGPNKPGLDHCAAGLSTVYDALQKNSWGEADIDERAAWLSEKAEDVWKI